MLNQIVKVSTIKGLEVQGKVYDATEDMRFIHIETENDFYCIDTTEATVEVVEEVKVEEVKDMTLLEFSEMQIEAFFDLKGIKWDGFSSSDECTYELTGDKYNVSLTVDEEGLFTLETTHNERASVENDKATWEQDYSKAWANAVTRKTLKGALNYAMKYLTA
ncbi:hypothetical protein ABEY65_28005 [Priestia aryabhattai]|uniref:hypothetical protein n=1 Tax=Priestia aryabhattai TaxID=412384 RepID=UPI003D26F063